MLDKSRQRDAWDAATRVHMLLGTKWQLRKYLNHIRRSRCFLIMILLNSSLNWYVYRLLVCSLLSTSSTTLHLQRHGGREWPASALPRTILLVPVHLRFDYTLHCRLYSTEGRVSRRTGVCRNPVEPNGTSTLLQQRNLTRTKRYWIPMTNPAMTDNTPCRCGVPILWY